MATVIDGAGVEVHARVKAFLDNVSGAYTVDDNLMLERGIVGGTVATDVRILTNLLMEDIDAANRDADPAERVWPTTDEVRAYWFNRAQAIADGRDAGAAAGKLAFNLMGATGGIVPVEPMLRALSEASATAARHEDDRDAQVQVAAWLKLLAKVLPAHIDYRDMFDIAEQEGVISHP